MRIRPLHPGVVIGFTIGLAIGWLFGRDIAWLGQVAITYGAAAVVIGLILWQWGIRRIKPNER